MATQIKLVTYDDYRNMPDDGKRYEIIKGELYMNPAPKTRHQRISRKLLVKLDTFTEEHKLGEIFDAPYDVVLSMTDVVQPDLLFVSNERSHIITENNIVEAPDLIIEIISESSEKIDCIQKKELYEQYGVKEYWIVEPEDQQIIQYILEDEELKVKGKLNESRQFTSQVIADLELKLSDIFET